MIKHQLTTLENGLRIVSRRMADSESCTIGFYVGAGGRYEDMGKEYGASHFLEHLLFRGTKRRPSAKQIAQEIDGVGGVTNAYTTEDHTAYYIKLPRAHFELAFDILSDILTDPLLEQKELDRERGIILEEIKVFKDDPARYVFDLVGDLLWPDNTLRTNVIGTPESIGAMNRDIICNYYDDLYTAKNMVIAVAGNIEHGEIVELAQARLGKLKSSMSRHYEPVTGPLAAQKSSILVRDTNQSHLILCARSTALASDDEPAIRLISAILGGGMSSRLYLSVCMDKGLAYSVYAGGNGYLDTGRFEISASVNREKTAEALRAIMAEVAIMRTTLVPEDELRKAKEQVKGRLIMAMENNFAVADDLGTDLVLTGHTWTLAETLDKIEAVSAEEIRDAMQRYLAADQLRIAGIGPIETALQHELEQIITQ